MATAIGYVRVSTAGQKDGVSLDLQREKIAAYCALNDLELIEVIEDGGKSAKNLKRPGIQKILKTAKSGKADAVVCYRLDRMFRSTTDALETSEQFDRWGVAFHSICERIDTASPFGEFFFTLLASLAQLERKVLSERLTNCWQHKKARGEKGPGITPFGFDSVNGKLVKSKSEQKTIRKILQMRDSGLAYGRIADYLNSRGIKSKQGRKWYAQSVRAVVLYHKGQVHDRVGNLNRAELRR